MSYKGILTKSNNASLQDISVESWEPQHKHDTIHWTKPRQSRTTPNRKSLDIGQKVVKIPLPKSITQEGILHLNQDLPTMNAKERLERHSLPSSTKMTVQKFVPASERLKQLTREQCRYQKIEQEYHALLKQVQHLQFVHESEITTIEKSSSKDIKALKKAMDFKSVEIVNLNRELQELQAKYHSESSQWINANEKLKDDAQPLVKQISDLKRKLSEMESVKNQAIHEKIHFQGILEAKEDEYKRFHSTFRRSEQDWNKEREEWHKLKLIFQDKEQLLTNLQDELHQLKLVHSNNLHALQDVNELKPVLEEAKTRINHLMSREKQLSKDLEFSALNEQKLITEIEVLNDKLTQLDQEKQQKDLQISSCYKEMNLLEGCNTDLKTQLGHYKNHSNQERDIILNLENERGLLQQDLVKYKEKIVGFENLVHELKRQNHTLNEDYERSSKFQQDLRNEKEFLFQEKSLLESNLSLQKQDLYDLQKKHQQVCLELENERTHQSKVSSRNSENLKQVTDRINDLQNTVKVTWKQIEVLKSNESVLREEIVKRDEIIRQQEIECLRLTKTVSKLENAITNQVHEFEDISVQRKHQVYELQSVFDDTQQELKDVISSLERQLSEKTLEITRLLESTAQIKLDYSHVMTEKSNLESQMVALEAQESSLKRQLLSFQSGSQSQTSENMRLQSKIKQLESQVSFLDREILILRKESPLPTRPSKEISEIQSNMQSLSEKVTNQLYNILE